jgi:hypothetical protein
MVFHNHCVLIEDGTLTTYEYNGNMVALLHWLQNNTPHDIHHLSAINLQEQSQHDLNAIVEIPPYKDLLYEYFSHIDQSIIKQRIFHYYITDSRIQGIPCVASRASDTSQ